MINKLHRRVLRNVLNNQTSNFETLTVESGDICNRHRNIHKLMTEGYKIQNKLAPSIMESMLERRIIL